MLHTTTHTATHCNTLQHTATHAAIPTCTRLHTAANVHHVAHCNTHCNKLHHTTTYTDIRTNSPAPRSKGRALSVTFATSHRKAHLRVCFSMTRRKCDQKGYSPFPSVVANMHDSLQICMTRCKSHLRRVKWTSRKWYREKPQMLCRKAANAM